MPEMQALDTTIGEVVMPTASAILRVLAAREISALPICSTFPFVVERTRPVRGVISMPWVAFLAASMAISSKKEAPERVPLFSKRRRLRPLRAASSTASTVLPRGVTSPSPMQ